MRLGSTICHAWQRRRVGIGGARQHAVSWLQWQSRYKEACPGAARVFPLHVTHLLRLATPHPFYPSPFPPQVLLDFLSVGCSVLLSDVDVIWLANPFDHRIYRDSDVEARQPHFRPGMSAPSPPL
jgi:hypothetical protein